MNWRMVPGVSPSGPASGEAATRNAATAITAISTRRLASRWGQPISMTVSSANSIPAANHEKNAGGQFIGLMPYGGAHGSRPQPTPAAPPDAILARPAPTGRPVAPRSSDGGARE